MHDLKSLILEAKKNVAPLRTLELREEKSEIILMKPKFNSVISKLMKHRGQDMVIESKQKTNEFKWLKMKEKMAFEMEFRRCQEWEKNTERYKKLNQEEEEECELQDDDDGDQNEDGLIEIDDGDEANDEDGEDLSDNEVKKKAEVDEKKEQISDDEKNKDSDEEDEIDSVVSTKRKSIRIINDDDDDDGGGNHMGGSFEEDLNSNKVESQDDLNRSIDTQLLNEAYYGNDLNFSFTTQLKTRMETTKSNSPLDAYDSQALLDLCSGTFGEDDNVGEVEQNAEMEKSDDDVKVKDPYKFVGLFEEEDKEKEIDELEKSQNDEDDVENEDDADVEDDADDEEEDEEEEKEQTNKMEDSDDDDDLTDLLRKKRTKRSVQQFFEQEAELSGSEDDVSSDENENDSDNEYEKEEILEDLPSDDEIRGQLEKIHNKNMLDEEKRQLMILKERFLEDGELYDGRQRKKKFEWDSNGQDFDDFTNVLSDSEEDNESDGEEDTQSDCKVICLKRKMEDESETMTTVNNSGEQLETIDNNDIEQLTTVIESVESELTIDSVTVSEKKITLTNVESKSNKPKAVNKTGKISSFVMRDRRLTEVLNKKTDQIIINPNKKLKSNETKSIFDLF